MPELLINNLRVSKLQVPAETTLLQAFNHNLIDLMQTCGGKGRCTTCTLIIVSGHQNLSGFSEIEQKFQQLGKIREHERLACQTHILQGEVQVRIPEKYYLPHMEYKD